MFILLIRQLLCEYADCIEGLGPLMPQTRDELCQELCRQRKMLPEFFHLFATPEMINLKIPDCSESECGEQPFLRGCTDGVRWFFLWLQSMGQAL